MAGINFQSEERLRIIIREETADMRSDIKDLKADVKVIKDVQGQQGMTLRVLQSDVSSLKIGLRQQTSETHRLGVLLEDLEDRFEGSTEAA